MLCCSIPSASASRSSPLLPSSSYPPPSSFSPSPSISLVPDPTPTPLLPRPQPCPHPCLYLHPYHPPPASLVGSVPPVPTTALVPVIPASYTYLKIGLEWGEYLCTAPVTTDNNGYHWVELSKINDPNFSCLGWSLVLMLIFLLVVTCPCCVTSYLYSWINILISFYSWY